ncbi:ABC transporter permease [Myroides sp. LJL115]
MIANWSKVLFKVFSKNKFFYILNILSLAIGVSVISLIVLLRNDQLSYNQWNPYKDRAYEFSLGPGFWEEPEGISGWVPAPFTLRFDDLNSYVESYVFYYQIRGSQSIVLQERKEFLYDILETQKDFFELMPFEVVSGSIQQYENNHMSSIALEESQAKRLFGDSQNAIGKEIVLEDGSRVTVDLVYQIPGNSSLAPMAIYSYAIEKKIASNLKNWGDYNYNVLVKFKEEHNSKDGIQQFSEALYLPFLQQRAKEKNLSEKEFKDKFLQEPTFEFFALDSIHLNSKSEILGSGKFASQLLSILSSIAITLFILCLLNSVNLALVSSFQRAKEVGVRKTLGASKTTIILQSIFESFIITILGFCIGILLSELALPHFNYFVDLSLVLQPSILFKPLLLVFLFIWLLVGLLSGIFKGNFNISNVLKGSFSSVKTNSKVQNSLLVLQFTIAFFFLSTSVFVQKQVSYLLGQDLGFKGDQVVNIQFKLPNVEMRNKFFENIEKDLLKITGVQEVSLHGVNFGGGASSSSSNNIDGQHIQSNNIPVSFDFLEVFDIKMDQGRFFDPKLLSDIQNSIVVNQSYVRELNLTESILGKEMRWNGRFFKIIGVVKDFNMEGFSEQITPSTFFLYPSVDWFYYLSNTISVKIDPSDMAQTMEDLEAFWKQRVDQTYPFTASFANEDFARSYKQSLKLKNVFIVLSIISCFIALVGLLTIVSFTLDNKLKQIAIRKVLGASQWNLVKKESIPFIFCSIIGFILAIFPTYFLVNLWLQEFVVRISLNWGGFAIGFILLFSLSVLLIFSRIIAATKVNVLKYIKDE